MGQKKRLGKTSMCPQCRCTHFFTVNFNRTPEMEGDKVAVPINCEKCNRQKFWLVTCQEWMEMKAEYKAQKASELKNGKI